MVNKQNSDGNNDEGVWCELVLRNHRERGQSKKLHHGPLSKFLGKTTVSRRPPAANRVRSCGRYLATKAGMLLHFFWCFDALAAAIAAKRYVS